MERRDPRDRWNTGTTEPLPLEPLGTSEPLEPLGTTEPLPLEPLGTSEPLEPLGTSEPLEPLGTTEPQPLEEKKENIDTTLYFTLLYDIYKISNLLLNNIKHGVIICLGQSPFYFGVCMDYLISLPEYAKFKDKKIIFIPMSGSYFMHPKYNKKRTRHKLSQYCKFIKSKIGDIENQTACIIDFSIRGDSLNDFSRILKDCIGLRDCNFVNLIDTYRFYGTLGPEIRNMNADVVMGAIERPMFNSKIIKYATLIGYVVSDHMEYFTMDNYVPRGIPQYRYYEWDKDPKPLSDVDQTSSNKMISDVKRLTNILLEKI